MAPGAGSDEQVRMKPRLRRFQDLRGYRVREILLLSSIYDSLSLAGTATSTRPGCAST